MDPNFDYERLEIEMQKSREKLKELGKILGRIGSLRNGGGDVFFKGLAKVFQTNPVIPPFMEKFNEFQKLK